MNPQVNSINKTNLKVRAHQHRSSTKYVEVQVKREPTFPTFLPLQMEVADNPGTSPLLLFLTHSLN
jgi:hypothetical protein